jgi:hypothetical protein
MPYRDLVVSINIEDCEFSTIYAFDVFGVLFRYYYVLNPMPAKLDGGTRRF